MIRARAIFVFPHNIFHLLTSDHSQPADKAAPKKKGKYVDVTDKVANVTSSTEKPAQTAAQVLTRCAHLLAVDLFRGCSRKHTEIIINTAFHKHS